MGHFGKHNCRCGMTESRVTVPNCALTRSHKWCVLIETAWRWSWNSPWSQVPDHPHTTHNGRDQTQPKSIFPENKEPKHIKQIQNQNRSNNFTLTSPPSSHLTSPWLLPHLTSPHLTSLHYTICQTIVTIANKQTNKLTKKPISAKLHHHHFPQNMRHSVARGARVRGAEWWEWGAEEKPVWTPPCWIISEDLILGAEGKPAEFFQSRPLGGPYGWRAGLPSGQSTSVVARSP